MPCAFSKKKVLLVSVDMKSMQGDYDMGDTIRKIRQATGNMGLDGGSKVWSRKVQKKEEIKQKKSLPKNIK